MNTKQQTVQHLANVTNVQAINRQLEDKPKSERRWAAKWLNESDIWSAVDSTFDEWQAQRKAAA